MLNDRIFKHVPNISSVTAHHLSKKKPCIIVVIYSKFLQHVKAYTPNIVSPNYKVYAYIVRHKYVLGSMLFTIYKTDQSALNRHTVQPFTESDDTRCCDNTICPPEDGHVTARNMWRIVT